MAVFEELFAPQILRYTPKQCIKPNIIGIRFEYERLATRIEQGCDPASIHRQVLTQVGDLGKDTISPCWSCFTRTPTRLLTCGHRLCNHCVRVYCYSSEHSYFNLPDCLLCGRKNPELIYLKPSVAGLRILRLSGGVRDATDISHILKSLRSSTRAPLYEHFDVVLSSGIGIFFAIMVFGKKASIEDCIHNIPNIKHARIKAWAFSFGPRLRFEREELQSNKVSLLLERYSKF